MDWKITDGTFKNLTFHVAIPKTDSPFGIVDHDISNERRLQISEKPKIDGADVEDFGRKSRTFSATVIFFGEDYRESLKAFEDKLNEGSSGALVLPDLDEAVWVKYQKHSRRSTTSEGLCTVLSVTWIEDRDTKVLSISMNQNIEAALQAAKLAVASGDTATSTPTILDLANKVTDATDLVTEKITNNAFVNAIKGAENAVIAARVTVNSVMNIGRNLRQTIISTVGRLQNDIDGLKSAINGISEFVNQLKTDQIQSNPLRYNTGVGMLDYKKVDSSTTTTVDGTTQVVTSTSTATSIQSYDEAKKSLSDFIDSISSSKNDLQGQTQGATQEINLSTVKLINAARDLLTVLNAQNTTTQVLTVSKTSLLEVCFSNGLSVNNIEQVQKKNPLIQDILDIEPFTIIYL